MDRALLFTVAPQGAATGFAIAGSPAASDLPSWRRPAAGRGVVTAETAGGIVAASSISKLVRVVGAQGTERVAAENIVVDEVAENDLAGLRESFLRSLETYTPEAVAVHFCNADRRR